MPNPSPSMPPLPEPSAWQGNFGGSWCSLPMGRSHAEALLSNGKGVRPLYTAEQVEAVADARVREAVSIFEYWLGKEPSSTYEKSCLDAIRSLAGKEGT